MRGGVVEAFVPISLVYREDVPVDLTHVNDLAQSILTEERTGRNSGQLSPVLLGELDEFPQFKILDGFHRVAALAQLERDEVFSTVRPNCTVEDVADLRIISATTHRSVRFVRLLDWAEDAWKQSPWAERIKISQAFQLRFSKTSTGAYMGLNPDEVEEIRGWVERKSQQWHIAPTSLYKYFLTASQVDPVLVREARGRESGHKLDALTPDHLAALANILPDRHDIQQVVADEIKAKMLTVPRAKALAQAVSGADGVEEAERIVRSIRWNIADQVVMPSGLIPFARTESSDGAENAVFDHEIFLPYFNNVQARMRKTSKTIFEIIGSDFANELSGNEALQRALEQKRQEEQELGYIYYDSPNGRLIYYPDRGLAISPLHPEGMAVELTRAEGLILEHLMRHPTMIYTSQLIVEMAGGEDELSEGGIKTHVSHLREKLGDTERRRGLSKRFKLVFSFGDRGYTLTENQTLFAR